MCEKLSEYLPKSILFLGESMAKHTTFNIGGEVAAYVEPRNKNELVKCVRVCEKLGAHYKVIGNASNLLFSSQKQDLVVISTRKMKADFLLHGTTLKVSAGANINEVVLWCAERGLSGLENLFGIPATVGGMAIMNAGAFHHDMREVVESVEVLFEGKKRTLSKTEIGFEYRSTKLKNSKIIVLSVELSLKHLAPSVIYSIIKERVNERKEKHPLGHSAGCVFKFTSLNVPAGKLIDEAGLKGERVGGAVVSEKHGNFILNDGGASSSDVVELIEKIQARIEKCYGIKLEQEIEYVGEDYGNNR